MRRLQTQLAERVYGDVGEEHLHDQQKHGEMSPGELLRGGTRDPIRVDISTTRHLGYGGRIFGSGVDDPGKKFASSFLRKDKIPLTHRRIYNYSSG